MYEAPSEDPRRLVFPPPLHPPQLSERAHQGCSNARINTRRINDINAFIDEVLACCPLIRAIWLVGDSANGPRHAIRLYTWDLIAFADPLTLQRLRKAVKLHRSDVRLRVMSDENRLDNAWGGERRGNAPVASHWEPSSPEEGYYVESLPASKAEGSGAHKRRKAVCVWRGIDPPRGPGS
jgi:hypothetical protein